jgi:alpha-glucosidase
MDAMGYNAETQDPLYKFCPFYVGVIPSLSPQVYGIYYNNFGETTMDFGQELDAVRWIYDNKTVCKSHVYSLIIYI